MFGWGAPKAPPPASTPTEAPTREQRAACWRDRDAYFACLDKSGVQIVGTEKGDVCKGEKEAYTGSCGRSWIDYFNKRRTLELRQKATLEAAEKQRNENPNNAGR